MPLWFQQDLEVVNIIRARLEIDFIEDDRTDVDDDCHGKLSRTDWDESASLFIDLLIP